jgi:hypothetical protein
MLCKRLDTQSFARSLLAQLDNLMLMQRLGHTMTEYVHFMRQSLDDYNETYEMISGFTTIHPHNLGLITLRGISRSWHYEQAKQCDINAFVTNYILSADAVMAIIMIVAQNMEEELPLLADREVVPPYFVAPPISAFLADGRGQPRGRPHGFRGGGGRRGPLPNTFSTCGGLDHIMPLCTTLDDALLKWTLAKRKMMIVQRYGTELSGSGTDSYT